MDVVVAAAGSAVLVTEMVGFQLTYLLFCP